MEIYPFSSIVFTQDTSILLDASFLISLIYPGEIKHTYCTSALRQILLSKCKLYITNIISAEVLNQLMYKTFIIDIKHRIDKNNPLNSQTNLRQIVSCFSKYDKKIIKDKKLDRLGEINYKKYFDNISKNALKRNLLKVYYDAAVTMHNQLEASLNFSYIPITKECINRTKELMVKHQLSINDGTHIAACEIYHIQFLLTLDADFAYATSVPIKILKI